MTIFARGVAKLLTVCPESSFGVPNLTPGAGQLLRRVSSDLNLNINQIESQEILPSQQVRDSRNGPRTVQGTISGQLSPATYSLLFSNLLRNSFATVAATAPLTDVSAALNGSTGNLDLTGSGADAFSSKFKVGDILRLTGVTGAGASADNNANFRVVSVSPSSMSLSPIATSPLAWTSGSPGEVFMLPGKKLIIPATGQVDQSLTFEHWYSDIGQSELFVGCKVASMAINFPASGFTTIQASITGQTSLSGNSQQLPSPAPITTTTGMTSVSGKIAYQGTPLAYITATSLQIQSTLQPVNVVGNAFTPAIFPGNLVARGTLTCLTTNDTLTSDFLAENEVSLSLAVTTSPGQAADFISFYMPRVKLTSSTKQDSQTSISRSFGFMALENAGELSGLPNLTSDFTTIMIQDSLTP